jgi:putative protease
VGDEVLISGPTTGVIRMAVSELRVNDLVSDKVKKGERFTLQLGQKIRASDKLYKLVDAS